MATFLLDLEDPSAFLFLFFPLSAMMYDCYGRLANGVVDPQRRRHDESSQLFFANCHRFPDLSDSIRSTSSNNACTSHTDITFPNTSLRTLEIRHHPVPPLSIKAIGSQYSLDTPQRLSEASPIFQPFERGNNFSRVLFSMV
jgi:hypothetical protein